MATTAQLMAWLAQSGARTVAGAVVASGKARFYDPGTLTPQTVYSDSGASSAITQPLTLDAAGRGTVFTLSRVRVIIKDSTDTTTLFDHDPVNATRAEHVLITNAQVNGGAETSLDAYFTNNSLTYVEGSAATSRQIKSWLQEENIKATDYAAAGNDSTDDTVALQAIIDRALLADRTNSTLAKTATVFIPAGTYKINGSLSAAVSSGTKQLIIRGAGPLRTVIKQYSTTADTLHLNYNSGTSCRTLIEELGVTCNTTSSGAAIRSTNANRGTMRRVQVALHRTGFDTISETGWVYEDCEVASTDSNAASVGMSVGGTTRVVNSVVAGATTGIKVNSGNSRITDCDISTLASGVGISIDGTGCRVSRCDVATGATSSGIVANSANAHVSGCIVTSAAIGIDINAANCRVVDCDVTTIAAGSGISVDAAGCRIESPYITGVNSTDIGIDVNTADCVVSGGNITGCATGIDVAAIARTRVIGVDFGSCTTPYVVSSSATMTHFVGNSNSSGALPDGNSSTTQLAPSGNTSTTPLISGGGSISFNEIAWSSPGSNTLTINATATTGLIKGSLLAISIASGSGLPGTANIAFNSQYVALDGTSIATFNPTTNWHFFLFRWNGTAWATQMAGDGTKNTS